MRQCGRERLCVKWSSQVVFETDLPPEAANAFSVYMSAHAMLSDCVFSAIFTCLFFAQQHCTRHYNSIGHVVVSYYPPSFSNLVT